jgi:hypothetical protein
MDWGMDMTCQTRLDSIRDVVMASAVGLTAATTFVLAAAITNVSFFGAPASVPLMVAASVSLAATLATLSAALIQLRAWSRECLAQDCAGKYQNLFAALSSLIALVTAALYMCTALIPVSWIPWAAAIPMGYLVAAIALAIAAFGVLTASWRPLADCGERVAKSRGPLRHGEHATDPWFLRIEPATPPNYEHAVATTASNAHLGSSQYLICTQHGVREWEVDAVAYLAAGKPTPPLTYKWSLAGNPIAPSASQMSGTTSTLKLKSPPLPTTVSLSVTATDGSGFTRTIDVDVSLADYMISCTHVLHFVPPMYDLPREAPGPVEITAAMDRFAQTIPGAADRRFE